MSEPTGTSGSISIKPAWPSASASSLAEHNIPSERSPLNLELFMTKPPGKQAFTNAVGTFIPFETFGAPHTICNVSGNPTSTSQILNLSALGCGRTSATQPTTMRSKPFATDSTDSTSRPAIVKASDNSEVESVVSQTERNQFSENFIKASFFVNRETAIKIANHSQKIILSLSRRNAA